MFDYSNEIEIYDTCEFTIKKQKNTRFKKYVAKINGTDPVFGLRRHFLRYAKATSEWGHVRYEYGDVPDGVYETSVKYFRKDADQPFLTDRKLCLVWEGDCFNYDYSRFSKKEILGFVNAFASGSFQFSTLPDD